MAFVYVHTRLDTNEVFYVGYSSKATYDRAYCRHGRNCCWTNIAKKIDWEVRIVADGLTCKEGVLLEKLLINFYGRKDKGLGSLCNKANGGQRGSVGYCHTDKAKRLISNARKEWTPNIKLNKRQVKEIKKAVCFLDVTHSFLAKKYKVARQTITAICNGYNWKLT